MNWEADIAMIPDKNVEAALNARSAWPIPPCWIGFGLLTPDFVKLRPARPPFDAVDTFVFFKGFWLATEKESSGATVEALDDILETAISCLWPRAVDSMRQTLILRFRKLYQASAAVSIYLDEVCRQNRHNLDLATSRPQMEWHQPHLSIRWRSVPGSALIACRIPRWHDVLRR